MRFVLSSTGLRAAAAACAAIGVAVVVSACSATQNNSPDVVAGKQLFVSKCGSCHTLARAGTKGTVGPNLDQAFEQGLQDGLGRSGIRALVRDQIKYPNSQGVMPAKLLTGEKADQVAAYVAQSVAKPGQDTGLLAEAVKKAGGGAPAVAKAGTLQIDADPTGQLAYVTNRATGPPGKLTVKMQNKSTTGHNIVIDGKGTGNVVANGGVSQFSATFAPGKYTYYCSVDGHRQAGMFGTLTIK
jgi:mono/diheme cytochrome c family protein